MPPSPYPKDWRVAFAVVLATLAAAGGVEARISRVAAMEIDPVREAISEHMRAAEEDRSTRRLILQKLDALCRATPQANCPLGSE